MAQAADLVLTGRCSQLESTWVGRSLVTIATVQVTDTLKGSPSQIVTVVLPGGIDSSRPVPVAQIWPDSPRLVPGQEALLFLNRRDDVVNGFAITGYSQGAFSIVTDPQGQKMVSRDLRSVKLSRDGKVEAGGRVIAPLSQLKSEIRTAIERAGRRPRQR
jgi:hypothetical protein